MSPLRSAEIQTNKPEKYILKPKKFADFIWIMAKKKKKSAKPEEHQNALGKKWIWNGEPAIWACPQAPCRRPWNMRIVLHKFEKKKRSGKSTQRNQIHFSISPVSNHMWFLEKYDKRSLLNTLFSGIIVYLYSLPLAVVFENSMTLTVLSFLRIYIYFFFEWFEPKRIFHGLWNNLCTHLNWSPTQNRSFNSNRNPICMTIFSWPGTTW